MPVETPPPRENPRPARTAAAKTVVATMAPPNTIPPPAPSPFPTITPMPGGAFTGAVGGLLGLELLRREIENLADDSKVKDATVAIVGKGAAAIPLLLEALERRDPVLRRRAFEVLKFVARHDGPLLFDPDGPEEVRLRQTAFLRANLERR